MGKYDLSFEDKDMILQRAAQYAQRYENLGDAGVRWVNYDRCVQIAEEGFDFRTNNITGRLKQFVRRESAEEFNQRIILTQHTIGAMYNSLTLPINKAHRVSPQKKGYDAGEQFNQRIAEIEKAFYLSPTSKGGVSAYLNDIFKEVSKFDPNGLIMIEWETIGENQLPRVQPKIIFCKDIYNVEKINGKLVEATICHKRMVIERTVFNKAKSNTPVCYNTFYFHGQGYICELKRIQEIEMSDYANYTIVNIENSKKEKSIYAINIIETKAPINVIQIGYCLDVNTLMQSFVTPFDNSFTYFHKLIKTNSELDLSIALHVFPQKIQYVKPCNGVQIAPQHFDPCFGGVNQNGGQCQACKGNGFHLTHKSGQDAMFLPMPSDPRDAIDLNTLIAYKSPDINLIEWLRKYVDEQLPSQIHVATYGTDILIRQSEVIKTATEIVSDMQPVYDVIHQYDLKQASVYCQIIELFVAITLGDTEKAVIEYIPTTDYKMKTRQMLLNELKTLNEAGGDSEFRKQALLAIAENFFEGDEQSLKKYKMSSMLRPFFGYTRDEIDAAITMDTISKRDKVLYSAFDILVTEIEIKLMDSARKIQDLTLREFKEMLLEQLAIYMELIESETPVPSFDSQFNAEL